jgi:hypothetical protein
VSPSKFIVPLSAVLVGSGLAAVGAAPARSAEVDPHEAAIVVAEAQARVAVAVSGSSSVETQKFNDFSTDGADPYVVVSTGNADDMLLASPLSADDPDTAELDPEPEPAVPSQSTDRGGDGVPDSSTVTLTVAPPANPVANECLYVDFALASEQTLGGTSGDTFSIRRTAPEANQEFAMNAGANYPTQSIQGYPTWPSAPVPYSTQSTNYWHKPGDVKFDLRDAQLNTPRLERWTRLNNVTTRDTARVPLDFSGVGENVVRLTVADAGDDGGYFDTAAMIDHVRFAHCGVNAGPTPVSYGVNEGFGSLRGDRRVGWPLTYDPVPTTQAIERYDAENNGWTTPSGEGHVELRFRWYRTKYTCTQQRYSTDFGEWAPIPNADRQTYVPDALDYNRCLMVLVTGVADGFVSATRPLISEAQTNPDRWYVSVPIDKGVFQDGATPSIVLDEPEQDDRPGRPEVGETLMARPVATRPLQDNWEYQWYANGSKILGATSASLPLQAPQIGKSITVMATATRGQFEDRSWTSEPTSVVLGNVMESSGGVTVTPATPTVDDTLTAAPGPICEVPEPSGGACEGKWPLGTSFTYQWTRDGKVISTATHPTYTTSTLDVGKTLRVIVGGAKVGYDAVSVTSGAVGVLGRPMTGTTPTISGTPKVGRQLQGSVESWAPAGATLRYDWYAGGTLLQSSLVRTLTVPPSAVDKRIELRVTGSYTGYETLTMPSSLTARVARGTLTAGSPRIIGSAKVGTRLTASPGYWGPSGVRLAYQWKVGRSLVTGPKGKRSTFVVPRTARGKRIAVIVTGTLAGYTTVKRTSSPTAPVIR